MVANFHDDEPGMLGAHYQVDIDWGDGTTPSTGQAWRTAGVGNWVATGGHTYAQAGEYWITVTILDTHAPTGMSTTTYSYVQVSAASAPGGGGDAGRLPPDVLAALLREESRPVVLPSSETPAAVQPRNVPSAGANHIASENGVTLPRVPARNADAWLGDVFIDVLAANLLVG